MSLPADTPAPRLPDYELLKLIGSGSYGDVWLARGVTGVFRAVKIVWRNRFADARPYLREFEGVTCFASVSLREPSQLALLHAGRSDDAGFFYYVMELADDASQGRNIDPHTYVPLTLKELRVRHGVVPPSDVVSIGVFLARALASLHAAGLVHRDVKPSNIVMIGGVPKLADVGLVAAASAGLTFVGTEGFVPPEGPGAPAADVYSLGKVLYELATGFDRKEWPRLPPDLATYPERRALLEMNEVLVRACDPNTRHRFAHAGLLLDELLLLQAGKSVRRLRAAERRTTMALRVAAGLAIVAGIAGGGAWMERRRANEEFERRQQAERARDELAQYKAYSGNLASAQRALQNGALNRARTLLEEFKPKVDDPGSRDIRGFEWHALWRLAQGDPHVFLRKSGPAIHRLVLSPDETYLAVHHGDQQLTLYDTSSHKALWTIGGVWSFSGFTPDGKWLLGSTKSSASHAQPYLSYWSATDATRGSFSGMTPGRPLASITPSRILSILEGPPTALFVWDLTRNVRVTSVECQDDVPELPWRVFRTGASVDGGTVVIAWVRGTGSNAEFKVGCFPSSSPSSIHYHLLGSSRPSTVAVDENGPMAVVDTTGAVWRYRPSGWQLTEEKLPAGSRRYVARSLADKSIRVVARSQEVVWLPEEKTSAPRIGLGHSSLVNDVTVSTKHGAVFSGGADGSLLCWKLHGPELPVLSYQAWNANGGTSGIVFSDDSQSIWVSLDGHSSTRLNIKTLAPLARAEGMIYPVALASGRLMGVSSESGIVCVDSEAGHFIDRLPSSPATLRIAAVAPKTGTWAGIDRMGNLVAAAGSGATLLPGRYDYHFSMQLSQRGDRVWLIDSETRGLTCLNWPEGKNIWRIALPALAANFIILPGEARLALALENGTIEIREAATGALVRRADAGCPAPQALASSPDGNRLFAGGLDGDIHCLGTERWDEMHVLTIGAGERIHQLACSPDGRTLAALTKTGRLHLIRAE